MNHTSNNAKYRVYSAADRRTVYDLCNSISRDKWNKLIRYQIVPEHITLWMEITEHFIHHTPMDASMMYRYQLTAHKYNQSPDNIRRIISRMLHPIQ